MTNSTDDKEKAKSKPKAKQKKPKKQGPIRIEAVAPVVIILILFGLYFKFFFDSHLRKGLEFGGTLVHGAEVNVGGLQSSVFGGYIRIEDIQVTDKQHPENNVIQIGKIRLALLWDALLRAKLVIEDATIENIQTMVPRKEPGRITPVSDEESQVLQELESAALDQTKQQFNDNVLGDLASVLGGSDPSSQLDSIKASLKSEAKLGELEKKLKVKEAEWKARIKSLPTSKQTKAWEAQGKALKFNTKNPAQFANDLQTAEKLIKQIDGQIKNIDKTGKDLNGSLNTFQKAFKDLDQLVKKDIADLQNRFKIPSLDVGDFTKNLFGRLLSEKLGGLQKYVVMAKEYMPAKKAGDAKKDVPVTQKRQKGKNFRFKITTGYPVFWLKKGKISSEPGASEYSGRISGDIVDVTSDPKYLGRPALLTLQGDFPKQEIFGLDVKVKIEHSVDEPYEEFSVKLDKYPLGEQKLSDSEDVKLIVDKATGQINIKGRVTNGMAKIELVNRWKEMKYQVDAKSELVKEILTGVMADIPVVSINAKAVGSLANLDWNIKSNLGSALANGFKAQVQKKIDQARAKLKNFVENKIKGKKAELQKQIDKVKAKVLGPINAKKAEVGKVKAQANNQMKAKKKEAKKSGEAELKKAGKKLLKGFGF